MLKRSLLPIIIILAFVSCGEKRYPSELVMADSAYMRGDYKRADSLLDVYEKLVVAENDDVENYHYLLQLERLFVESAITEEHFSRIDSLCRYYSIHDEKNNYAKALMFQGESYYCAGDNPSALECFLKTVDITEKTGNKTVLGLACKLIGKVYFSQRMFEEGARYHRRSLEIAKECHDTLRIIHAAMHMGLVYTAENKVDSALSIYYYTMDLIKSFPNRHISTVSVLKWRLADLYTQIGEYDKALPYLERDSFYIDNWAYWHLGQNHVDSAIYYFEKELNNIPLYGKKEVLRSLIKLEKEKSNFQCALDYADRLQIIEDSLEKTSMANEITKTESRHKLNIVRQERDQVEMRHNEMKKMVFLGVVIVLLLALASIYAWKNHNKSNREKLLQERCLRMNEAAKLKRSEEQIERNNEEIALLQEQLLEARSLNNQDSIDDLELRKGVLLAENSNIEASLLHQDLMKQKFNSSSLIKRIKLNSGDNDFHLSNDEWNELSILIDETYNDFTTRLLSVANLDKYDLHICYLTKLGIPSSHIAKILYKGKSSITMARRRLYEKIMKCQGTPTQFNKFITDF